MQYTQNITLDMNRKCACRAIYAKRLDNSSRFLNVKVTNGNADFQVEEDCSASLRYLTRNMDSNETEGVINNDGTVRVELDSEMLSDSGTYECDISFTNGSATLSTPTFYIIVTDCAVPN